MHAFGEGTQVHPKRYMPRLIKVSHKQKSGRPCSARWLVCSLKLVATPCSAAESSTNMHSACGLRREGAFAWSGDPWISDRLSCTLQQEHVRFPSFRGRGRWFSGRLRSTTLHVRGDVEQSTLVKSENMETHAYICSLEPE